MRYLLDTNVVEHAWRYSLGSENVLADPIDQLAATDQERLASDLRALHDLLERTHRGAPEFIVAAASLRELAESNVLDADRVMAWAQELAEYAAPVEWAEEWSSLRESLVLLDFVRLGDAVLICETARLDCTAMLTCDYRLARQRHRIRRVSGVDVLTPSFSVAS